MGRSWTKGANTLSNNIFVTSSKLHLVLYEATMYKKQPDVERSEVTGELPGEARRAGAVERLQAEREVDNERTR
jgi:hypothetical protein